MIFSEPGKTAYDLNFNIGPVPVRIHPFFWLIAILLGANGPLQGLLLWVVAITLSILIHELGHVFAFARYGVTSHVVLHGFGGLAIPRRTGGRGLSRSERIWVSLAGPFAGFLFAALILIMGKLIGGTVEYSPFGNFLPYWSLTIKAAPVWWNQFLWYLLYVNLFWGYFNLLPVYPLDGGQVSMELHQSADPSQGRRRALQVSMVVAAVIAVIGYIAMGSLWLAFLFGYMAYSNYQTMMGPRW